MRTTGELAFIIRDDLGARRLLITDTSGNPLRSSRFGALRGLVDLAPIATGPNAGDLGALLAQPSVFVRISL